MNPVLGQQIAYYVYPDARDTQIGYETAVRANAKKLRHTRIASVSRFLADLTRFLKNWE